MPYHAVCYYYRRGLRRFRRCRWLIFSAAAAAMIFRHAADIAAASAAEAFDAALRLFFARFYAAAAQIFH